MLLEISKTQTMRSIAVVIIATISLVTCQLLKFYIFSKKAKKPVWSALLTTGGMPSSHTSTMISLLVSLVIFQLYYDKGLSYEFSIALALTAVVMYDATGVRYEAGKHARILNEMIIQEPEEVKLKINNGKTLKELIGHRPLEVLGGFFYGTAIALICCAIYIFCIGR